MKCRTSFAFSMAAIAGLLSACAGIAYAQSYPARPITLVVPFPPGAGIDTVARVAADELTSRLGQPTVVENRPGAGGMAGARIVVSAQPDGHSLLVAPNTIVISPYVLPKEAARVDVLNDLVPIINMANNSMLLAVTPQLKVDSLKELVELAKRNPGLHWASGGNGSPMHIVGEQFRARAGIELSHVPYKGAIPSINDVVGGQVPILWAPSAGAAAFVRNGRLRAIALADTKRSPSLPDVPSMAELGYPDVVSRSWAGVLAPKGTPLAVVTIVNRTLNDALKQTTTQKRIVSVGYDIVGGSPEAFAAELAADDKRYGQLVKEFGIRAD
jgi:tripartite-type tricarboxylate transporter receptor subunit TctC